MEHTPPACYIAASYVKAVEASGARVVPIFLSKTPDYYRKLVESVNGVVFPGGDANITTPGGYYDAAKLIYNYTRQVQERGDNFPLLGVCLGHEALAQVSDPTNDNALDSCPGLSNVMLPLVFRIGYRNSSLYAHISPKINDILTKQNVTPNFHSFCVRPESLKAPWHILSDNVDSAGKEFVSSMERPGPIVGIQFHPEKNAYEWQKKHPSYEDALLATRYFYDWLVTEARKNNHSFADSNEEQDSLIYNYSPSFSGKDGSTFTQKYIFGATSDAAVSLPWKILGFVCSVLSISLTQSKH